MASENTVGMSLSMSVEQENNDEPRCWDAHWGQGQNWGEPASHTWVHGHGISCALVGYGMVRVVLALPPVYRKTLQTVADEVAKGIVEPPILEHLVMQEIVG